MKNESPTLTLVKTICRALDAKKAEALRVSDVRAHSSITDYIIVATGTADTHLRALRVELEKVLDAAGARILGMDGQRESGWLVVDAFDVMIHLFLGETRQHYRLEQLWQDAPQLDLGELLAEPKPSRTSRTALSPRAKKVAAASPAAPKKTRKPLTKAVPAAGTAVAEKVTKKAAVKKTAAKTAAAAAPEKGTRGAAKKPTAVKKVAATVKKDAAASRKAAAPKKPAAKKTVAVKKAAKE
ncbi:ribosome silencing factor [Cephaloticoccus primus]|uniref:ribosome silencing factor n=1 Tax=Cephaloticoccus primus TaxID=1548207 RepID=UPI0008382739|nr:ribosome silencing factor [Cephaloticoccus primus]